MPGLRTVAYPVADLDAARLWYEAYFGVKPYYVEPWYVGFDIDGYELGLMPAKDDFGPSTDGGEGCWDVGDIQTAWQRALDAGATPLLAPWNTGEDIWVASFRDPFGNRVGLINNPHFVVPPKGSVTVNLPPGRMAAVPGEPVRSFTCALDLPGVTPAQAFAAFTSAEALGHWFGSDARMELRIGGPFEILFYGPEVTERGSEGCSVLSWIPDRMLSFTWNAPPHMKHTRLQYTWVVVEFVPTETGCRALLTHTGWPESGFTGDTAHPEWPQTWDYFQNAWPQVLKSLAAWLAR
jgi:uncharacterized protein YndB with AHSA1/START domain/predicted enzyme related to lactoylglutathione lyase